MTKTTTRNPNDRAVALTGEEMRSATGRLGAKGNSRFGAKRKGKYEFEVLQGTEYSHNGRMALKLRVIDRVNDRYIEIAIEEESRKVLIYCNEPLSAHFGHGSAKPGRTPQKRRSGRRY